MLSQAVVSNSARRSNPLKRRRRCRRARKCFSRSQIAASVTATFIFTTVISISAAATSFSSAISKLPHTMGHEIEGEVIAIGPDAEGVKLGDRRAAFPWIGCGNCPACLRTKKISACATQSRLFFDHRRRICVARARAASALSARLRQHAASLAAAYMCSGITAFSALKKVGHLGPGDEVMILGCGGVGMMGLQFAKEPVRERPDCRGHRRRTPRSGEKGGRKSHLQHERTRYRQEDHGDTNGGVFAIVDFVGSEATFAFANSCVRKGGRIIIVGLFGGAMSMPLPDVPDARACGDRIVCRLAAGDRGNDGHRSRRQGRPDTCGNTPARSGIEDAGRSARRKDHRPRGVDAVTR